MGLHEYTPGFQFPRGYEPLNPVPVDSWSGPYAGGSTTAAISTALGIIPAALRFLSMEVRILAPNPSVAGQTLAYKYWFRGNTGTLEEFSSGAATSSSTSNDFPQGISSAGATFTALVNAYSGISSNFLVVGLSGATFTGLAQFGGGVTAQSLYVSQGTTLNGNLTVSGGSTFTGLARFGGGVTAQSLYVSQGATLNGNLTVSGGSTFTGLARFGGGATAQSLYVSQGATLNGNLTVSGGTTLSGRVDVGGVLDVAGGTTLEGTLTVISGSTFTGLATFNGGITASSIYVSRGSTFNSRLDVNALATFNAGITSSSIYTSSATIGLPNTATTNLTVNGDATIGATLTVNGNFFVAGTVTTVNRTDLQIDDKIIVLGRTLSSSALADGGGIQLESGASDKTWTYKDLYNAWQANIGIDIPSGFTYSIGGTDVLTQNKLGPGIVNSSLTSVGTISSGKWRSNSVVELAYGGSSADLSSSTLNGIVYKAANNLAVSGAGTSSKVLSTDGSGVPTWVDMTALTGLTAQSVNVSAETASSAIHYLTFVSGTGVRTVFIENSLTEGLTFNPSTGIVYAKQWEGIVDGGTW